MLGGKETRRYERVKIVERRRVIVRNLIAASIRTAHTKIHSAYISQCPMSVNSLKWAVVGAVP